MTSQEFKADAHCKEAEKNRISIVNDIIYTRETCAAKCDSTSRCQMFALFETSENYKGRCDLYRARCENWSNYPGLNN